MYSGVESMQTQWEVCGLTDCIPLPFSLLFLQAMAMAMGSVLPTIVTINHDMCLFFFSLIISLFLSLTIMHRNSSLNYVTLKRNDEIHHDFVTCLKSETCVTIQLRLSQANRVRSNAGGTQTVSLNIVPPRCLAFYP